MTADKTHPALTVRDLLDEEEFGIVLLAGAEAVSRPIEGIHLSELEDPTPWMAPRSLLLSTGVRLRERPEAGRTLIDALSNAGMSGLGIALGHYMDAVPSATVERAGELGLPLFTLPLHVPFRRVTAFVYQALAAGDAYRLRRSLSLQSRLLDLLVEERGEADLVIDLAGLLDTTVLLFDGRGRLIAQSERHASLSENTRGALFVAYGAHRSAREPLPAFAAGGYRISYREVVLGGRLERLLMAAYSNRPIPELAETTLSFAQKLLTLDRLREQDSASRRRHAQSALLSDVVSGERGAKDLNGQLTEYGFDPAGPWRLVVLQPLESEPPDVSKTVSSRSGTRSRDLEADLGVSELVAPFFEAQGLSALTMEKSGDVLALVQLTDVAPAAAERTLLALMDLLEERSTHPSWAIGISATLASTSHGPAGLAQALESARVAREAGGGLDRPIRSFDRLPPHHRLLERTEDAILDSLYAETVRMLDENDRRLGTKLVGTLETFLACDRSPSLTARRLGIHRNTLAKRLRRAESLLGATLTDTDTLVAVGLGLSARSLLAGRKRASQATMGEP